MSYALRIHMHLEEPLLATGVANGEENSSISLDHIPGSTLRGVCAAAYLRCHNTADFAADAIARRLFFGDEVRFLNGYPAYPTNTTLRALPCPLSWHMSKDDADNERREVRDYALEDVEPFEKSKEESRSFFWPGDEAHVLLSPRRWTNVHNASLNPMLKQEGESTVFRYEALASEQDFVAYIVAEDKRLLEEVETSLLPDQYHLGGSQTAGYGLVTLATAWETDWRESQLDYEVDDFTIITLLSDSLLRDDSGRATTDFHRALCIALDRQVPQPQKTFAGIRLVGSFNRKWGLPLPQRWAVTKGSTVVYAAKDLSADELALSLRDGIGDRCGEGFGRLGINLNSKGDFTTSPPTAVVPTIQPLSLASAAMAQRMARQRLMQAAEIAILRHISEIDFESGHYPHNTQLSRLRLVVRQAQRRGDLSLISQHLNSMKKPAAEQFARHRLNVPRYQTLVTWEQWLRDRASKCDGFSQLELKPDDTQWHIAGRAPEVNEALQCEVTCQLIETLLRKALKEERQDG
jgi:CRISPR-associated protein Csx10